MKNIILIISDTFRWDNLRDRATMPVNTPMLDKFMDERAISVEGMYMNSFPTIPHRTDLTASKVGWLHYPWQDRLKSSPNHIPEILRKSGYISQLICDCPHLFNANFNIGFDAAFVTRGQEGDKPLLHFNDPIETVMPHNKTRSAPMYKGHSLADVHRWTNRGMKYESETFPARTADITVRWLEENHEADPFFLWVDFFDPHEPWDPPEYLVKKYDPDYKGIPMIHPNYGHSTDYTDAELKNIKAHYAAEAELVDTHVGRILKKIDDLQLWDDSIVIFTADHGHLIGEHGRVGKSNISDGDDRYWPIYPTIAHVPLLIAGGDIKGGSSLDLMAQPVDIFPTVCDLADVSADPAEKFEGKSFAEALKSNGSHRDYVVSGSFAGDDKLQAGSSVPFITDGEWGLAPIGSDGECELYHLKEDPYGECNLADKYPEKVSELKNKLKEHLIKFGASDALIDLYTK